MRALTQRRTILDRLIASHRGRIANTAGDFVLAEFGSAVDAVRCAEPSNRGANVIDPRWLNGIRERFAALLARAKRT